MDGGRSWGMYFMGQKSKRDSGFERLSFCSIMCVRLSCPALAGSCRISQLCDNCPK